MLGASWGGSEELWSQAAIRLRRAGHEVQALVPYRRELSEKLELLAVEGVAVQTYPSPTFVAGWYGYLRNRLTLAWRRASARLRRFAPEVVVISQGEIADGLEWARICREGGIPYIQIVHCNSESFWFEKDAIDNAVASYRGARKVFCVSQGNLALLRLQLGEPLPEAEILWNPYNVCSEAAPEWPAEGGVWKIACVGRLEPAAKGQDILFQVLARPEWRNRSIEVSLFGRGPQEVSLQRMKDLLQLDNVHFRGHVSDVRSIWEEHHMLALPSRYEGLPLVLVESMWCGRPAIVTDVAGNAELCVDGETGFVAQSASSAAFAETMERAWNARSEWKKMGEAARARAEQVVPKDPIGLFCEKLENCAAGPSQMARVHLDRVGDPKSA